MKSNLKSRVLVLAGTGLAIFSGLLAAQQTLSVPVPLPPAPTRHELVESKPATPEPDRWTTEDITLDEQFATAKKETMAAYQIAIDECKHMPAERVASCTSQARHEMESEMARIKAQFGMPN